MKIRIGVLAAGLVLGAVAYSGVAQAKPEFLTTFNGKYKTSGTRIGKCVVCHTAVPNLNRYGNAFKNKWKSGLAVGAALTAIHPADSDLDTFSNITEIKARKFPGRKADHP